VRGKIGKMERRQADAFLRSVTWLAEAPVNFQDQVLAKCDMLRFKKSDLIYDAGDEASGLFGVVEGHLEVHRRRPGSPQPCPISAARAPGSAILPRSRVSDAGSRLSPDRIVSCSGFPVWKSEE
jgi:hypothetical protein